MSLSSCFIRQEGGLALTTVTMYSLGQSAGMLWTLLFSSALVIASETTRSSHMHLIFLWEDIVHV